MNYQLSKNFYDVSKIPNEWNKTKLKYILSFSENNSLNFNDEKTLSLTKNGIVVKDITTNQGQIAESYEKYILIKKGQICMNPMDLLSGWVDISNFEGLISPAYYTFLLNKEFDNKFINYFLQSNYLRKTFFKLGKGVASHDNFGRWVLTPDELKNIIIFTPKIKQQKIISQYLDKKTKQIKTLIKKVHLKIELLKEELKSLINQSVTGSADLNVEMKESGIKSIGLIPKHWKIVRLAVLGEFSKGKNITKSDLVENGEPVILYSHLYTKYNRIPNKIDFFISDAKFIESSKIIKNTFLFTSSGETVEEIGKTILYKGEREIAVGGDLVIFQLNDHNQYDEEFLSFAFNSKFCQDQKSSNSRGDIVVHIYKKQLREVKVCIPPIDEQSKIALSLILKEKNIHKLITKYKEKIIFLNEYEKSIISSVVMGMFQPPEEVL